MRNEKDPNEGFRPVKVRWRKTVEGVPVFSGIAQIVKGEIVTLDPSEAGRAIASGLAERVTEGKPAKPTKAKEDG